MKFTLAMRWIINSEQRSIKRIEFEPKKSSWKCAIWFFMTRRGLSSETHFRTGIHRNTFGRLHLNALLLSHNQKHYHRMSKIKKNWIFLQITNFIEIFRKTSKISNFIENLLYFFIFFLILTKHQTPLGKKLYIFWSSNGNKNTSFVRKCKIAWCIAIKRNWNWTRTIENEKNKKKWNLNNRAQTNGNNFNWVNN